MTPFAWDESDEKLLLLIQKKNKGYQGNFYH